MALGPHDLPAFFLPAHGCVHDPFVGKDLVKRRAPARVDFEHAPDNVPGLAREEAKEAPRTSDLLLLLLLGAVATVGGGGDRNGRRVVVVVCYGLRLGLAPVTVVVVVVVIMMGVRAAAVVVIAGFVGCIPRRRFGV